MKKKGSICDYIAHRNEALVRAFKAEISRATIIDLDQIFRNVSRSPAERFFVSEQRAMVVITHKKRTGEWTLTTPLRVQMFEEIEHRADALLESGAVDNYEDAVYEAVNSEAPCFYLTPRSCRTIIYEALKN